MAVRIRQNGQILCAAMHPADPADTYLDDVLHERLASGTGALVTEPMHCDGGRGGHANHGEWWWRDRVPADVEVDPFYSRRGATSQSRLCLEPCAVRAERMAASARDFVVGLDVVALGALVVVVMFIRSRLLGMERAYLGH